MIQATIYQHQKMNRITTTNKNTNFEYWNNNIYCAFDYIAH